jgi:hypothetical protein
LLTLGALGGYTTYSTFALARLELLADNGKVGAALLNTMGQLVAGLALAYIGVLVVRGLQGMGGTVWSSSVPMHWVADKGLLGNCRVPNRAISTQGELVTHSLILIGYILLEFINNGSRRRNADASANRRECY